MATIQTIDIIKGISGKGSWGFDECSIATTPCKENKCALYLNTKCTNVERQVHWICMFFTTY